jgi:NAD(P)-dependent dehydrogenase (short-subunit alcohol dehydrogenase family)
LNFHKTIAREDGRYNININGISVGGTKTERISKSLGADAEREKILRYYPLGRLGLPQDIANAATFFYFGASQMGNWADSQC